jgi:hypothetical protein
MADQDNNNRDWTIDINLAGVAAATGNRQLPEGQYKAVINDAYIKPENPGRVVFRLTVSEGPFAGIIRTTGINVPAGDDDRVRYYWRALAESVGYTAAQLDDGTVTLSMGSFKNRVAHIDYTPADPTNGKQYDSVSFLPPAEWTRRRDSNVTTVAQAMNDAATPGKPMGGDAGTVSKSSVMQKLGL